MNGAQLRNLIVTSLEAQGFSVRGGTVMPPQNLDKEGLRRLHLLAVQHRIEGFKSALAGHEGRLLKRFAVGADVDPEQIAPILIEVRRGSEEELLFRYAALHWSVPVSSGYGRRLRFLVVDSQNGCLVGLFGLGDPVFNLGVRDTWIGWNERTRRTRLHHVMDAFVLGAVPPYSSLLCGKLVAMLAASNEVREAFRRKYAGHRSLIRRKNLDARLALITTTSALGRSSLYNRLSYNGGLLYQRIGFTRGAGEFHFLNGLYGSISRYADRYCEPTAKQEQWGTGFRSRREVIKKCLSKIGLSTEMLYHHIPREVVVVPLARNSREFLRGEHSRLQWSDRPATHLFAYFRERWLRPRSGWDKRYQTWHPDQWLLWPERKEDARTLCGSS